MKIIAVANCTSTKAVASPRQLRASSLKQAKSLRVLARQWQKRLTEAEHTFPATDLYRGRGLTAAVKAATQRGVGVCILSAGMGLVNTDDEIPSYSLTVTPNSKDFVLRRVKARKSITTSDWWTALTDETKALSIAKFVENNRSALIVLGLSSPYLYMISGELLSLSDKDLCRVRIVGPKHLTSLPGRLRTIVMPYDSRLNGPDSEARGTEFDFAQRALASFIRLVHEDASIAPAAEHARRVRLSLSQMRAPKKAARKRVADCLLKDHIRAIKKKTSSVSAGLRILRNERRIACEQKRFARLWA